MNRRIKQNQIPIITYAGGWKHPPTLEDLGYDPRTLIKKVVLKEQERTREELRKQELHELNMQVLKAQLNQLPHSPTHYSSSSTSDTKFPEDLLRVLESNNGRKKASNEARRMARKFKKTTKVANYLLMRCITPSFLNNTGGKRKFSKGDYMDKNKKGKYDNQIQERIKTLNKYWIPKGFKVAFGSQYCQLIKQD